ncbi:MAG TPA: PHB depolymerase family esterase [Ktedonobacterales bacterium]|nr:PHB depolymerase family esterase [Ktedonobacterales bacterium]
MKSSSLYTARLRWLLLVGSLMVLLAACQRAEQAPPPPVQHDFSGSLSFGGLTRTYQGHLPTSYENAHLLPLVLALHGHGGDGQGMLNLTHLNTIADEHGFIVVYPDGYQKSWADGRGVTEADQAHVDDVGFLSALIDTLASQYKVDRSRVYVTGISNGGFMSERLACDLSNKVAAVATVAAPLPVGLAASCAPKRPVPFLLMQGTADPLVPVQGGTVLGERGTVISASATIQKWVGIDGCPSPPATGQEPDTAHDGTRVSYQLYSGCGDKSAVALYLVAGGGHTWPGGLQYLPVSLVGKTSQDIDAGEVIWAFFQPHRLA